MFQKSVFYILQGYWFAKKNKTSDARLRCRRFLLTVKVLYVKICLR